MTASKARLIGGASRGSDEDAAMRTVLAAVNSLVSLLSRTAQTRELDSPATAEHLHRLSQRFAGVTLDALRAWPDSKQ